MLSVYPAFAQTDPGAKGVNVVAGPRTENEVVVGAYAKNFPYSSARPDGSVEGFSVELLDALARVMDLKIRRVVGPNEQIQERFRAGEFDLLQTLAEAKGRETWADYSVPIIYTQNVVFVRKGKNAPRTIEEMKGMRFAIAGAGSVSDHFLRARDKTIRIIYADSAEHALRLVESGEADGTLLSRLTATSLIEKHKLKKIEELRDRSAYLEIRHGFAVHKGDTLLLARLNEGLAILQRSGEYDRIYGKWLGRFESGRFSREQVITYVACALAVAFLIAVGAGLRERKLRRRIVGQANDLADQGELLGALYENVPLAICVFELAPDGTRLRMLNRRASELLSVSSSDSLGRRFDEVQLAPDWMTLFRAVLRNAQEFGGVVAEKHTLPGSQRHLVVTRVPLAPRSGGMPRLCVLVEDVTDRWRLDEEVSQGRRLRAVGELVGGIAHEFNNLMTPVMLKVSDIRSSRVDDPELQVDMKVIGAAVQRAADLTARLLTFGRKSDVRTESVQIGSVVRSAFGLLQPTSDRRILWDNKVPDDMPPLVANPSDLNQILMNLLLNARDTVMEKLAVSNATEWVPRIAVEAEQVPLSAAEKPSVRNGREVLGWQRLTVSDNGQGIRPEVKERIFEPFFTTKRVGQGTGLGLATVWHMVTAAGGRVDVNTTPGEGSQFHVTLPICSPTSHISGRTARMPRAPGSAARILLVEDEQLVCQAITGVLRRAGHQVQSINDGQEAWAHLQTHHRNYDLLVVDINMPGIDGLELTRRARSQGFAGRVLIVSGRLATTEVAQFETIGIDGVLPKPFNSEELLAVVEACLNK